MSRNQSIALATLGLAVAAVFTVLAAYVGLHWPPDAFAASIRLLPGPMADAPPLITLDSCIVVILILGLGLGLARWKATATAKREKAKSTSVNLPLYTCPICLAGPVVQRHKSRFLRLATKREFICRACRSVLEPAGDTYRYRRISPDYPDMQRHSKKVFYSWHQLRNLAWEHPKRQQRAAHEAAMWERRATEISAKRHPPKSKTSQEPTLEPRTLNDFIGQHKLKERLSVSIDAAKARGDPLGHALLRGPEGCGKKTLALLIARHMNAKITLTSGRDIQGPGDLANIITNLGDGDILFIADIHRLRRAVEERLHPAMQDSALDIVIGKGISAKTIHLPLPCITVIGATPEGQRVSAPLRRCFEYVLDFKPYEVWALGKLVQRLAKDLGLGIDENARLMIARACGGSLREARRLVLRARDYAQVRADGVITAAVAHETLAMMEAQRPAPAPERTPATPEKLGARPTHLTWQEFEELVAKLFTNLGYQNVTLTSRTGDEGKDIVMERADPLHGTTKVYVECKHWRSNRVGIRAVQVLHSAVMRDPEVDEGMLVTTGAFTHQALAYARQIGFIRLIDRKKLRELMLKAGMQGDQQMAAQSPRDDARIGDDRGTEANHDTQIQRRRTRSHSSRDRR